MDKEKLKEELERELAQELQKRMENSQKSTSHWANLTAHSTQTTTNSNHSTLPIEDHTSKKEEKNDSFSFQDKEHGSSKENVVNHEAPSPILDKSSTSSGKRGPTASVSGIGKKNLAKPKSNPSLSRASGSGQKTQSSERLTDQDLKILEEKQKIDSKMKRIKWASYATISGVTLVLIIIMGIITYFRNRVYSVKTQHPTDQITQTNAPKAPVPLPSLKEEIKNFDELKKKVVPMIEKKEFASAGQIIGQYQHRNPQDHDQCKELLQKCIEGYLSQDPLPSSLVIAQFYSRIGEETSSPSDILFAIQEVTKLLLYKRDGFVSYPILHNLIIRYQKLTGLSINSSL